MYFAQARRYPDATIWRNRDTVRCQCSSPFDRRINLMGISKIRSFRGFLSFADFKCYTRTDSVLILSLGIGVKTQPDSSWWVEGLPCFMLGRRSKTGSRDTGEGSCEQFVQKVVDVDTIWKQRQEVAVGPAAEAEVHICSGVDDGLRNATPISRDM